MLCTFFVVPLILSSIKRMVDVGLGGCYIFVEYARNINDIRKLKTKSEILFYLTSKNIFDSHILEESEDIYIWVNNKGKSESE